MKPERSSRPSPPTTDITITEIETRDTELGPAQYIKIKAAGYRRLGWEEVWGAFQQQYPDRWAVEAYPPADQLVNGKCVYHLFVLDHEPKGLNIR